MQIAAQTGGIAQQEAAYSVKRAGQTLCVELRRPSLIEVFRPHEGTHITYPETYFKACTELITVMLGGSLILTLLFNYQAVWNNPLNLRIGYPNMCVAFDTFPAKYYAVFCWGFVIFLGCKFAFMDIERTMLVIAENRERQKKGLEEEERLSYFKTVVSITTDVLFMLSLVLFSLVFVIPPTEGVWRHSGAFIVLIAAIYLVVLANIMEATNAPIASWVYIIVFGIVSVGDVTMILGDFIHYDRTGTGPLFPVVLGAIADYGWFAMVPLGTIFLPNAEGIKETKTVFETKGGELAYLAERAAKEPACFGLCGDDDDDEEA